MGTTELQRFIDNKSLTALKKYAALELQLKEAKEAADQATEQIKQAMIDNNVTKIDGDWGYITLAERSVYKAEDIDKISPRFTKKALDSGKIRAEFTLKGKLPTGVAESKTQYITKRFKEV